MGYVIKECEKVFGDDFDLCEDEEEVICEIISRIDVSDLVANHYISSGNGGVNEHFKVTEEDWKEVFENFLKTLLDGAKKHFCK